MSGSVRAQIHFGRPDMAGSRPSVEKASPRILPITGVLSTREHARFQTIRPDPVQFWPELRRFRPSFEALRSFQRLEMSAQTSVGSGRNLAPIISRRFSNQLYFQTDMFNRTWPQSMVDKLNEQIENLRHVELGMTAFDVEFKVWVHGGGRPASGGCTGTPVWREKGREVRRWVNKHLPRPWSDPARNWSLRRFAQQQSDCRRERPEIRRHQAKVLPKCCRNLAMLNDLGTTWVDMCPSLVEFGPSLSDVGRTLAQTGPKQNRQTFRERVVPSLAEITEVGRNELGFGREFLPWALFDAMEPVSRAHAAFEFRPNPSTLRPALVEVGPSLVD